MLKADPEKEKLFKNFKSGEGPALGELLAASREELYDYLMRMTGQISRSADTVDEVYQSLSEETLETCDSWADLKSCLYATARRFTADVWNADTQRLVNAALEDVPGEEPSEAALRERQAHRAIDRGLKCLKGVEREAVILRTRAGLSFEEIATIMAMSEERVEISFETGMKQISAELQGPPAGLVAALAALPGHPMLPMSSQATMNLSMVMQGIKARPVGLRSPLRVALLLTVVLLVGARFFCPDWFQFAWLTQLFGR